MYRFTASDLPDATDLVSKVTSVFCTFCDTIIRTGIPARFNIAVSAASHVCRDDAVRDIGTHILL